MSQYFSLRRYSHPFRQIAGLCFFQKTWFFLPVQVTVLFVCFFFLLCFWYFFCFPNVLFIIFFICSKLTHITIILFGLDFFYLLPTTPPCLTDWLFFSNKNTASFLYWSNHITDSCSFFVIIVRNFMNNSNNSFFIVYSQI